MTTPVPQPRDAMVRNSNASLHYLDWGDPEAPALILLHHVGSQAHTWDQFAARMSSDYRVLALDLRGHGDSSWARPGCYTTEHYALDVEALVDNLGLERIGLLGGSLGGRVGLAYAALHTDKAAALVMEDVGPVRPEEIANRLRSRVSEEMREFADIEEIETFLRARNTRTPAQVFQYNAPYAARQLPTGTWIIKRDPATAEGFVPLELWNHVEALECPLLMVIGSESEIVSPEVRDRVLSSAPDSEAITISDAGHYIVHEQPEAFEDAVRGFFTKRAW